VGILESVATQDIAVTQGNLVILDTLGRRVILDTLGGRVILAIQVGLDILGQLLTYA
jgi:hypothetical protein